MHTSNVLQSSDFRYWRIEPAANVPADFACLFPNYHDLDRVGVISLSLEDGVLGAGRTLLALATAFYDAQRARGESFFNYPQHFALLGGGNGEVLTRAGTVPLSPALISQPWGNLDVWPDSNWHLAPALAEAMLGKAFDLQLNRLFWPDGFLPRPSSARLPNYVQRMLHSRLKAVYYYRTAAPTMAVEGGPKVERVLRQSRHALPIEPGDAREPFPSAEQFRQVSPAEFLGTMSGCFAEG